MIRQAIDNNFIDRWLRDVTSCKPCTYSYKYALKFTAVFVVMLTMFYPLHRILLPFVHEGGHYLMARLSGVIPLKFIVGAEESARIVFDFLGTTFYMGLASGGSQVVFENGTKTCLIAIGGPGATLLLAIAGVLWIARHRGRPLSLMYIIVMTFVFDLLASTMVNLFVYYPGSDGVYLNSCIAYPMIRF